MQQTVFTVTSTEWLTPSLVRVIASADDVSVYAANASSDKYAKLFFVDPSLGIEPPYDISALRERLPQEQWPVVRTYSIRWVDEAARRIAIDFVVHGDEGVAGPWAAAAKPGDLLVASAPGGAYAPDPAADWHVFVGDESAMPAIGAALEALRPDARGVAYLDVHSADDQIAFMKPDGVALHWLYRSEGTAESLLADAVAAGEWVDGDVQVFAHGEREAMKALREVFRAKGVRRERLSLSGYWARGRTEDRFQAEKREPIGKIAD
jgi:NADPH-dependent ferric siderophore reductase